MTCISPLESGEVFGVARDQGHVKRQRRGSDLEIDEPSAGLAPTAITAA